MDQRYIQKLTDLAYRDLTDLDFTPAGKAKKNELFGFMRDDVNETLAAALVISVFDPEQAQALSHKVKILTRIMMGRSGVNSLATPSQAAWGHLHHLIGHTPEFDRKWSELREMKHKLEEAFLQENPQRVPLATDIADAFKKTKPTQRAVTPTEEDLEQGPVQ